MLQKAFVLKEKPAKIKSLTSRASAPGSPEIASIVNQGLPSRIMSDCNQGLADQNQGMGAPHQHASGFGLSGCV